MEALKIILDGIVLTIFFIVLGWEVVFSYRVPLVPGLVRVIEQGRRKASLCLQSLERVPNADIGME